MAAQYHTERQEEIFGSGYAAAVYLSSILKFPKDKRVYLIGEAGLEEELDTVGIAHAGGTVSLRTLSELVVDDALQKERAQV